MAKPPSELTVEALEAGSAPARVAALAELVARFNEREKPRRSLSKAAAETLVRLTFDGKTGSRYLCAFEPDGKAAGFVVMTLCAGPTGLWAYLNDSFVPDGARGAQTAQALLQAALDRARAFGARAVATVGEPDSEGAHALCDEFGMTRAPLLWRELAL